MMREPELKGFQRLVEVCQRSALPVECLASKEPLMAPGESFLGQPFDPFLAALYARTDGAMLGDLQIYPLKDPESTVLRINRGMRRLGEEPYLSALLFGQIPLLAYYLATVPPLADSGGIQPVIFINGYEGDQVLPVASNVDQFFRTFSIYLERAVLEPEFVVEHRLGLRFPESILDVVARDRPMVDAMSAGRFSWLIRTEESREWISKVVQAAP